MENFLYLEGAYIILSIAILIVTAYVSTRDFMAKGAIKKALIWVLLIESVFIISHYYITDNRMKEVEIAFNKNEIIICESRATRKVAQSVYIQKSKQWTLKNNNFKSPNYNRVFFIARCITVN